MDRIEVGLVIVLALVCLIGISSAAVPDLIGNWTGISSQYLSGAGYSELESGTFFLNITEQHDRIFSGASLFRNEKGEKILRDFAGVISTDGTGLSLTEEENGYSTGKILGPDEIELTYLTDRDPICAAIDRFTRSS
jgi:hypothetical protein